MKNTINGGLPAALFVGPFLLFSICIFSCGSGGGRPSVAEAKSLNTSPDTTGPIFRPRVIVTCVTNGCGDLVLPSHDSSAAPRSPRIVLLGRTAVNIPANTDVRVEVYFDLDSIARE